MDKVCKPDILKGVSGDGTSSNLDTYMMVKFILYPALMQHPMVGVPILYIFRDLHQLPPVEMNVINYEILAIYPAFSDFCGRLTFVSYINRSVYGDTYSIVVILDEFFRGEYLNFSPVPNT